MPSQVTENKIWMFRFAQKSTKQDAFLPSPHRKRPTFECFCLGLLSATTTPRRERPSFAAREIRDKSEPDNTAWRLPGSRNFGPDEEIRDFFALFSSVYCPKCVFRSDGPLEWGSPPRSRSCIIKWGPKLTRRIRWRIRRETRNGLLLKPLSSNFL